MFVVLPDTARSDELGAALPFNGAEVVRHPSGRSWMVGVWSPGECTLAATPRGRVAVIGYCPVKVTRLAELAARVTSVAEVASLARRLPGSFHLVATVDGVTWVQGTATGLRPVFHTVLAGVPVASDRSDVLAGITGAGIDEDLLATRVVCGMLPPPLGERSIWKGVRALPPDHGAVLASDRVRQRRWWIAPEPDVPLEVGAARLREALETAVADRRPDEGRLSADLSGGMDSTSLCFLIARRNPDVLTLRWAEAEAGNDDAVFASAAGRELVQAEPLVLAQQTLPAIFAEPEALADAEAPYLLSRTVARIRATARILAEHGSAWHVGGHGGDELFCKFPGYLHGLIRRRPRLALQHLQGYRALSRWPLGATIAALASNDDLACWWRAQGDQLLSAAPSRRYPRELGWGMRTLHAPPWATPGAVHSAQLMLRRTAEEVEPLAADRGQHQYLEALRTTAQPYRQFARLYAESGVQLHMPYLDDRVVEAALSVRLHERNNPWRYKTLLAEAMRGIVPEINRTRTTKGGFGEDLRVGFRRNRSAILELFADSVLAQRELIDPDVLRARLLSPQVDNLTVIDLEFLLGCETWLRAVTDSPATARIDAPAS